MPIGRSAPAILLGFVAAFGAAGNPGDPPDTPAARYRAVAGEYQARQLASLKAINQAKSDTDRRKALAAKPSPAEYAERFLELARSNAKDEAAFDALSWVLTYAPHGPESDEALELLARDQLGNPRLRTVLQRLLTWRSPAAEALLRAAVEKSPHREVRAQACYSLATMLTAKAKRPSESEPAAAEVGEAEQEKEKAADKPPREEAEALYQSLETDYGNVRYLRKKTYADLARAGLARLKGSARPDARAEHGDDDPGAAALVGLDVGMRAPEIVGLDTDGRPMRLSAYRGKVVVLDFWGNW